jgi:hypothetical protein
MTSQVPKFITLRPSKAPSLLVAPTDYSQRYQDQLNNALRLYFNQVDNFTQGATVPDSGPTNQRPITTLLTGQIYFDTDLNIPIWWDGSKWVNASGTTV